MSQQATRKDIDQVIDIMKDFMSQVSQEFVTVNERFEKIEAQMDNRFSRVDNRFSRVDNQFAHVNERLDAQDAKYDHLINTIDSFIGRIDRYETELAARDSQFDKLLVWARKVSEKTGIPLENL